MLRLVLVTAVLAACHPAPAPTVVHAAPLAPLVQRAVTPAASPVRQDFDLVYASYGPLAETIVTGHGPCEIQPPRGPILFVATEVEPCKKLVIPRGM